MIFTGIKIALQRHDEPHPEKNQMMTIMRRILPMTRKYEADRFFVRDAKQLLVSQGLTARSELRGVNCVLDAAASAYVTAAAQAVSTLLYYGFLFVGQRQED